MQEVTLIMWWNKNKSVKRFLQLCEENEVESGEASWEELVDSFEEKMTKVIEERLVNEAAEREEKI